jgi:hypothetical protein
MLVEGDNTMSFEDMLKGDVVNQYLLDVNIPRDTGVPLEVYIAFPEALKDTEKRENIRKQWLYGNNKQIVSLDLMFQRELSCIYRPIGLRIDWINLVVSTLTPSGLEIVIPNRLLNTLGSTTEERVANLNDYLYVHFYKDKQGLIADTVVPLRGTVSEKVAKELLDSSVFSPLELLLIGLGYRPEQEVKRLFIPRILAWFKGFDGRPMHTCQFTLPESGKTTFGLRSETLFNWRYFAEPPTLARLVLDARSGVLGEVFLRNGIVFDEFDKWTLDTADRRYTFDSILTGMEQGKWERGVSAMGVRTPDVSRLVPIVFFGNLGDFEKLYGVTQYNARAFFNAIYSARLTQDVRPLCDRLCVIDACYQKIEIMNYLTNKVLPDGVIRGIISLLQKEVKECNDSKLSGRMKRHGDNVYAVLSTMMKIDVEFADGLVSGFLNLDKYIKKPEETVKQASVPQRG